MTGHLITTPITVGIHPRCSTPVLTGVAEGIFARVDLTPLNRNGEIHALCVGLQTYTLIRDGLIHRDASRIGDADLRRAGPVLAEHRCHRLVPADQRHNTAPPATTTVVDGYPF